MVTEKINFNPVPRMNPKNEPIAILNEWLSSFFVSFISPSSAPMNAPRIIPNGGKKSEPTITPTKEPVVANFDPPIRFVMSGAMIASTNDTITIRTPHTMSSVSEKLYLSEK